MSLIVYITENCKADALRHSLSDELERFKHRIESTQSTSHFNPFPPPYLVKKKLGGRQGRLIADLRQREEHGVVVFLAIMIRGDKAYENQFAKNPVAYGDQHFKNLVSEEELDEYIAERLKVEPPPVKHLPSNEEFGFLYESFAHRQASSDDDMVYETLEWKEAVSLEKMQPQLVRLAKPCLDALTKENGIHCLDVPDKHGWKIWIHREPSRLLLITPETPETTQSAQKIVDGYRSRLENAELATILRASRRAYPAYMLADEDTWVEIEKEPVANMALSPEESEVLLSARSQEGAFPLFVNGRAGSGKSTILQYLFADLLFYYLTTPAAKSMAPPVYLTANGELLRVARSFIERILRNEASLLSDGERNLVEDNREIIGEAFREFQPFLLGMVDAEARRERFNPSNRVDFSNFKKLWNEWFGRDREAMRDFGADISWHVIRSYIKGMSSESFLDPDDYLQLPENQISVTPATFEKVYERVWEGRYSSFSEGKGLWDDQDLARYIVEHDLVKALHPAVVCDEAQDFTRIELELLLRLNLFSNRSIPPHDLSKVPFAFAGDQFQTLNPTGFRWDAIKASFVEKFIHALDPRGRSGRTELNYRELRYNYRSTPAIVRFSNGIQALRSALFDMPELRPQAAWAISQYAFPVTWFDSDDAAFWKKFREVGSFIVVVPCNEGEEADFVAKDPVLRENIRIEDGIPQNLLSAARAKGREYPVVVIYGFGDSCPDDLMDSMESSTGDSALSLDHALPHQYFINRLYVAASRPKQRLVVVDSEAGIRKLWEFARSEDRSRKVLDAANRGRSTWSVDSEDQKSPVVEIMTMGKSEDLTRESAADPIENAKAFEQDGKARKDAFLLRQAALAYRSANNTEKAAECRARALELEGSFIEAAQNFAEAGFFSPEAVRCYWRAGNAGWSPLVEIGTTNPTVARETEFRWALKLQNQLSSMDEALELLEEVVNRMPEIEFGEFVLRESSWHDAIGILASKALQIANPGQARVLANLLMTLESAGVKTPTATTAQINYKAGDLQKAIHYWEKAGNTNSDDYARAKAATAPYPEKLAGLARTASSRDVVTEFEKQSEVPLDASQWGIVAEAYLHGSQFDQAIDATWKSGQASVARKAALSAIAKGDLSSALLALKSAVVLMVQNNEWETLSKFASTLDFAPDTAWAESGPRELVEANAHELQCLLVRALARSDAFTEMPGHLQRQFSDFLRRFLRVKEGQWREHLSVEEAGSAIERGGRFTDALAFYEAIQKETNFSEPEKAFAQKRWLVCKIRQIDYERQQDAKSRRLGDLQRELAENQRRGGVARISDLPRYHALDPLDKGSLGKPDHVPTESPSIERPKEDASGEYSESTDAESSDDSHDDGHPSETVDSFTTQSPSPDLDSNTLQVAERASAQLGDIRIELSRTLGRCNFSNISTMQTAHMNLMLATIGGELEWQVSSENSWFCAEWNLDVQHSGSKLVVKNRSLGISITLETPAFPA